MPAFHYQSGELLCEGVSLESLVRDTGSPCYVYSEAAFLGRFRALRDAFSTMETLVCYSVKACSNLHILRLLCNEGSGFDVVSVGELERVLEVGCDPAKVIFAGVGKTDDEIQRALDVKIRHFTVESRSELGRINQLATEKGVCAPVALRVNPDVDPQTHQYITTGKKENKFGIDPATALELAVGTLEHAGVKLVGLHVHIGSQVSRPEAYVEALQKLLSLRGQLAERGVEFTSVNLGGGFAIDYQGHEGREVGGYAAAVVPLLADSGLSLELEPGRWIAGPSGILLTRVVHVKQAGSKRFVIVDAAMNDLLRPSLYGSFHPIWPVKLGGQSDGEPSSEAGGEGWSPADVVGPVCESGDFLARDRLLPELQRGDLLAVGCAGAYGLSMASNYNSRPRPSEVLVQDGDFRTIRRRETYGDLVAQERT